MEENDYFTFSGATRLAIKIQVYWILKGVAGATAWVEPVDGYEDLYQVRSNIPECISGHLRRHTMLQRSGNRSIH